MYPGWEKSMPKHKEHLDTLPTNAGKLGSTTSFVIPKMQDYVGRVHLIFALGLDVVQNGLGTAAGGIVPGGCYQAIKSVTLSYSSGTVERFSGEDLLISDILRTTSNDKQLLNGLTDIANAIAFQGSVDGETQQQVVDKGAGFFPNGTSNVVTYHLELPFYWTRHPRMYLPYLAMANDIHVTIEWYSQNHFIYGHTNLIDQADPTRIENVALLGPKLRIEHIHVPNEQRRNEYSNVNETSEGVLFPLPERERHVKELIKEGTTVATINLSNLRSPSQSVVFFIRKASELTETFGDGTDGQRGPKHYNFHEVKSFHLRANNGIIVPERDHVYATRFLAAENWANDIPLAIYPIDFADHPMDTLNHSGSLDFGNLHNPQLVITFNQQLDEDYCIDVLSHTHNYVQLKGGDIQRLFL